MVSDRFWRTRLAADADVIGRQIWLNRQRTTIIGVAEQDFQGLFPVTPADIFVPVTADPAVAPELADNSLEIQRRGGFGSSYDSHPASTSKPPRPLSTPGRDSSTTPMAIARRIKKLPRPEHA